MSAPWSRTSVSADEALARNRALGPGLILRRMSRFVFMLLALLLPLQAAWATAASYCQHESDPIAAQHFGHHEHEHKTGGYGPSDGKALPHLDCGTCHATHASVLLPSVNTADLIAPVREVFHPPVTTLTSALPRAPDRPQWLRLA